MKEITYKDSGVDKSAGYESVEKIKRHVAKTYTPNVLSSLGSFSAFYKLNEGMKKPVLVSGTDGVGTKLKVAIMADRHDSVGIDLVAMCVNDILCQGARPLFFLDYIACEKNEPSKIEQIVKGIAEGCMFAQCSLIGGETAEMPGMYQKDDYDLAGFAVGVVEEDEIINGSDIQKGDVVVGLASSGIHSNGYSLVRKLFFEMHHYNIESYIPELSKKLYEELLTPTKIYVKAVLPLIEKKYIKGVSHITGGGFYENIPRMLPKGLCAVINKNSFKKLPVFDLLARLGNISEKEMFSTFNMGIGMVLCIKKENLDDVLEMLKNNGEEAYAIGYVDNREEGVIIK
jgi:phosphoribosylformylglycinamidine cyclo-ligase